MSSPAYNTRSKTKKSTPKFFDICEDFVIEIKTTVITTLKKVKSKKPTPKKAETKQAEKKKRIPVRDRVFYIDNETGEEISQDDYKLLMFIQRRQNIPIIPRREC
jgi:hypothetical protein